MGEANAATPLVHLQLAAMPDVFHNNGKTEPQVLQDIARVALDWVCCCLCTASPLWIAGSRSRLCGMPIIWSLLFLACQGGAALRLTAPEGFACRRHQCADQINPPLLFILPFTPLSYVPLSPLSPLCPMSYALCPMSHVLWLMSYVLCSVSYVSPYALSACATCAPGSRRL